MNEERRVHPPEREIKQHDNQQQDEWDDQAEPRLRALQILELPGPGKGGAGGQFHLLCNHARRIGDHGSQIPAADVDVDPS